MFLQLSNKRINAKRSVLHAYIDRLNKDRSYCIDKHRYNHCSAVTFDSLSVICDGANPNIPLRSEEMDSTI